MDINELRKFQGKKREKESFREKRKNQYQVSSALKYVYHFKLNIY